MTTVEMNEKINTLASDETFMTRVQSTSSVEEYQRLLSEYGVDTSVEELLVGLEKISSMVEESGELTPEALDMVAGGRVNAWTGVGLAGQIGCTLVMMAGAATPLGWYAAACACGAIAIASLAKK